jgi:hypothetical protein
MFNKELLNFSDIFQVLKKKHLFQRFYLSYNSSGFVDLKKRETFFIASSIHFI